MLDGVWLIHLSN